MARLIRKPLLTESFKAGGTITKGQAVKLDTSQTPNGVVACGAGEKGIGLAMEAAASGDSLKVCMIGIYPGVRGAPAVTAGLALKADANGKLVPAATGDNVKIIGYALDAPSAANELFPVFVLPHAGDFTIA